MIKLHVTITDNGDTGGLRCQVADSTTATDREVFLSNMVVEALRFLAENLPGTEQISTTVVKRDRS